MTTADLNQLLITGHVRREPELREELDGDSVCSFVLTHTSEHEESGHWELQFYNVTSTAPWASRPLRPARPVRKS